MPPFIEQIVAHPYASFGTLVGFLAAAAFVAWLWGFMDYVYSHGNDDRKDNGRGYMVWGAVWLLMLFSVWEVVRWIAALFGFGEANALLVLWIVGAWLLIWAARYLWKSWFSK